MPVTRNSSVQHAFKSNYVTFKKSVSEQNTINYDWLAIGEGFLRDFGVFRGYKKTGSC